MAGTSYQQFVYDGFRALNTMFTTDAYSYNNLGAGEGTPTVGSWKTSKEMGSWFGRINYSFKGRYLLTATMRCDGSSDFAVACKISFHIIVFLRAGNDARHYRHAKKKRSNPFHRISILIYPCIFHNRHIRPSAVLRFGEDTFLSCPAAPFPSCPAVSAPSCPLPQAAIKRTPP